ncbi:MAG: type II secretion system F family protein [Lentisphaeria bacterium]
MAEILVLILVFAAVAWGTWVVTPLIAQAGLERGEGGYLAAAGNAGGPAPAVTPMLRFTTPERLRQARLSAAILGGGLAGCILLGVNILNVWILGLAVLAAAVLAFQVPAWWLAWRIKQRRLAFEVKLLDLTVGVANGLRAGAALPQSLELVARDIGGPMQEELAILLHEYRLGIDLAEALNRMCARMPGEDLFLLTSAVRLTLQSGGSLSEVLDRITDTIRNRTEFQEKLRTMTAQGRFEAIFMASAPMLAFLLIYWIQPELMRPMVTTKIGWCAIGAVVTLEVIGFLCINKIVTVEV